MAPQPYVSPRRQSQARSVQSEDVVDSLNKLTGAAEEFINTVPRLKQHDAEHQALLDAIMDAQSTLLARRMF